MNALLPMSCCCLLTSTISGSQDSLSSTSSDSLYATKWAMMAVRMSALVVFFNQYSKFLSLFR